jgi:SAM-dependent methyltransferase
MERAEMAKKGDGKTQEMSFVNQLRSEWATYRVHRDVLSNVRTIVADHHTLLGYLNKYVGIPVSTARLLEVGCGQTAVQTALFQVEGGHATGIDIEVPSCRMSFQLLIKIARCNGIKRALKSLIRHVLFDKRLFLELSKEYGHPVLSNHVDARVMDATSMAFDPESFDFVYSRNVFEHIEDVSSAVREMLRVLKPSGAAVIFIHLFPSLSGGHCWDRAAAERSSKIVPPWDHLRENKFPANTYLNRLTLQQYREIFRTFAIVAEEKIVKLSEDFLPKEIEKELAGKGYSKDDLLTNTVTFVMKKRIPGLKGP